MPSPNIQGSNQTEEAVDQFGQMVDELAEEGLLEAAEIAVENVSPKNDNVRPSSTPPPAPSTRTLKPDSYYFGTKGFDVVFQRRTDGSRIKGKLIEWMNPNRYLVVGIQGQTAVRRFISATELLPLNPGLNERILKYETADATRDRITSLLEDYRAKFFTGPTIDTGGTSEKLIDSVRLFETPDGLEGAIATSVAGYKHETDDTGQPKDRNEDAWYGHPKIGLFLVGDAMGGSKTKQGPRCVRYLAEEVAANENDIPGAANRAREKMAADTAVGSGDGVCFLAAKLKLNQPPELYQCGDLDFHHYSATGETKYAPEQRLDQVTDWNSALRYSQSAFDLFRALSKIGAHREHVETVVEQMFKVTGVSDTPEFQQARTTIVDRIVNGDDPIVEMENPLYEAYRKIPVKATNQKESKVLSLKLEKPIQAGDWMALLSDGAADNLKPGELDQYIQMAIQMNWSPEHLMNKLSKLIEMRIKMKADGRPEAEKNHYKLDNVTIMIVRAKAANDVDVAQSA